MRILVTGSSGHLGEALVRTLRLDGHDPVGLDLLGSSTTDVTGSIGDRSTVRRALRGVQAVLHTATLHKPHVGTVSRQAFVDTNISGTLVLLEEAVAAGVDRFVFTSTTSSFGRALRPVVGAPAVWITEDTVPVPRNVYGVTKIAAESVCELVHRDHRLATVILRTSRFFPEPDDDALISGNYPTGNVQANEMLYRRVDLADVVQAHLCALDRAPGDRVRPVHRQRNHPVHPGGSGGPAFGRAGRRAAPLSRLRNPLCRAWLADVSWNQPGVRESPCSPGSRLGAAVRLCTATERTCCGTGSAEPACGFGR